jgi:hypothetical protein
VEDGIDGRFGRGGMSPVQKASFNMNHEMKNDEFGF